MSDHTPRPPNLQAEMFAIAASQGWLAGLAHDELIEAVLQVVAELAVAFAGLTMTRPVFIKDLVVVVVTPGELAERRHVGHLRDHPHKQLRCILRRAK